MNVVKWRNHFTRIAEKENTSYFDGMEVRDDVSVLSNMGISVKFKKLSGGSGTFIVSEGDKMVGETIINKNFQDFSDDKKGFVRELRFLLLNQPEIGTGQLGYIFKKLKEDDLKKSRLRFGDEYDLGHGVIAERFKDKNTIQQFQKEGIEFFSDFIYRFALVDPKTNSKHYLSVIPVSYEDIDEIYHLKTADQIRGFLTSMFEETERAPINFIVKKYLEQIVEKELRKSNPDMSPEDLEKAIKDGVAVRLSDSVSYDPDPENISYQDIIDYNKAKKKELGEDTREFKNIEKHLVNLIKRIQKGESVSESEMKSLPRDRKSRPAMSMPLGRMEILLSQLSRKLSMLAMDVSSQLTFLSESNKTKEYSELSDKYKESRKQIKELRSVLTDESDTSKKMDLLEQINLIIQNTSDFIKKY